MRKIKEMNPLQEENLKAFKNHIYNKNIQWFNYRINNEKEDFPKHLAQKIQRKRNSIDLSVNLKRLIRVKTNILRKIYDKLKEMEYKSVKEIEKYLGASFKNPLYYGSVMKEEDFVKLMKLLGFKNIKLLFNSSEIPHEIIIGRNKQIELKKSEDVAELIAIMLGDGHLNLNGILISIALNNIDDERYVIYVRNLLTKLFKGIYIAEKSIENSKGYVFIINSKSVHQSLMSKGLIPGNKVKNQVDIPNWIFLSIKFSARALKGLFDTDGSISVNKKSKSLILSFSNASKPIVEGFKKLCNSINIQTGRVNGPYFSTKKSYKSVSKMFMVSIESKEQVKRFLQKINPEKFKEPYRYYWLGLNLMILGFPIYIRRKIEHAIEKYKVKNSLKKLIYSKRNVIFLKALYEKEFKISSNNKNSKIIKSLIDNEIKKSLT